jgi:hypothetical protein
MKVNTINEVFEKVEKELYMPCYEKECPHYMVSVDKAYCQRADREGEGKAVIG